MVKKRVINQPGLCADCLADISDRVRSVDEEKIGVQYCEQNLTLFVCRAKHGLIISKIDLIAPLTHAEAQSYLAKALGGIVPGVVRPEDIVLH